VRAHNGTWLVGLCAALALSVPSWLPWLGPRITLWQGTPGVDDAKNHLLRTYVLGWLVSHGAWFPRWFSDLFLGYGYPLFNYYAPASYYLALVERLPRIAERPGHRAVAVRARPDEPVARRCLGRDEQRCQPDHRRDRRSHGPGRLLVLV
jgi:hypothetical protein